MKKKITLMCLLSISLSAYSQVGIHTQNPQGALHVDGAKDNAKTGAPTLTQQLNDFTVTPTGKVGIGTITPAANVDIVGTTFGIKNAQAPSSGSWDNLWFNVGGSISSLNASGAEQGLQFNVGSNSFGTYGDGSQILKTVATMLPSGNLGINTTNPARILDVNANAAPIRLTNLATTNTGSTVLSIDTSGDIRSIPFNNLLAGASSLTNINVDYTATGDETILWNSASSITVTLPMPTQIQVGKTIVLVGAGGQINLAGVLPTVTNSATLSNIPTGKRISIFAINTGVLGNSTRSWVVIAKDF